MRLSRSALSVLSVFTGVSVLTAGLTAPAALAAAPASSTPTSTPGASVPGGSPESARSAPDRPARGPRSVAADGEVVALRTASSRTYQMPGGRLQARLFDRPVNHRGPDGQWVKNDNRIAADAARPGRARNGANSYQLSLPKTLSDGPVEITADGATVGFTLRSAVGTASTVGNTATYRDAIGGVDLEYQATDTGVKETLVLPAADAPTSYVFDANLSRGLRLQPRGDGGLQAVDAAGTEKLRFLPPSVEDSSGSSQSFSSAATRLSLTGPADAPTVTLSLEQAYLVDPARVFPIRLDPSFADTVPTQATYVNSGATASNYSAATVRRIGVDTSGNRNHTLVKFDVSVVPRDVTVFNAALIADVAGKGANAGGTTLQAKAITRTWTGSLATWATHDGSNIWATPGGDSTTTDATSIPFAAADTSVTFAPTAVVADWVTGARASNGLLLSSTSTVTGSYVDLSTSSAGTTLFIDYVNRTGEQNYYTYSTRALTDRAQAKVNVATGNLLLANADHDQVGRFYNSRGIESLSGVLPNGWTQTPGNDELLDRSIGALHRGVSGAAVPFYARPDGSYISAAGTGADLDTAGAEPTLTDRTSGQVRTFDAFSNALTAITDRNGNRTSFPYEEATAFYASGVIDPAGRRTNFAYTGPGGRLASMTDVAARTWTYGYDTTETYLTSYTDPAGKITTYGYNTAGLLSQIVTPAGRKTLFTYDSLGRTLTLTQVTNTTNNTGPTTTYAYSATGAGNGKTTVTDPNSKITTYFYDATSRVTKVTDALNRSRSASYNADNSITSAVDAMTPAGTSSSGFDTDFRSTGSTSPSGGVTASTYTEAAGPVTNRVAHWQPATATDSDGNKSAFTYDGPGNTTKVQDTTAGPTGGVATSYTYNPPAPTAAVCGGRPGQTCTATDGRGKITRYTYEADGDLSSIDNVAPLGDESFSYDSLGRVVTATDGKGQITRSTYDARDRITQTRYAGITTCTSTDITAGNCITRTYDNDGNLTATADQTGTTSFGYDLLGRETSRSLPSTGTTSLTYDPAGNVLTATDASGTITYAYDAGNQLTSLLEPGGSCTAAPKDRCTTFGYNSNGVRTTTTYPTGSTPTVMTMTPDISGRVGNIKAVTGTAPAHSDLTYTYSRMVGTTATDGALTRTRVDNTATGAAGKTTTYTPDTLSRLTSAVEKDSAGLTTATWSYGYDAAGNRTSATLSPAGTGVTTAFTYNDANQILTRAGVGGFSYDGNGAETAAVGVTTRTAGAWNAKQQNTSTTAGGAAQTRTYTGQGNGTRLSVGGTTLRNTALGVTAQTTGGTTTTYVRDPGGTLVSTRTSGTSHYYVFDGLGSVVALISPTGGKAAGYSYDPYGQTRTAVGTVTNAYRYTGGYLDPNTALYKFGIRYYDPALGRFTQPDPTGQDDHYVYARNNPVFYSDPSGAASVSCGLITCTAYFSLRETQEIAAAGIGGLVGALRFSPFIAAVAAAIPGVGVATVIAVVLASYVTLEAVIAAARNRCLSLRFGALNSAGNYGC